MSWADNIPSGGILCRHIESGCRYVINRKVKSPHGDIITVTDDGFCMDINELTQLTPSEWWGFAPWNYDMDSAPKNGTLILLKDVNNYIVIAYSYLRGWTTTGEDYFNHPIAWLPLPEQK